MLTVDDAAILRAAGLLDAFRDDDAQRFGEVLGSDPNAFMTFCALVAYADRLADCVAYLTDDEPGEVISRISALAIEALRKTGDNENE